MTNSTKAHFALLGANLFYAIGFSVAKMVMPVLIQPSAFILIRVVCATILFWGSWFLGSAYQTKIDKKDFPLLLLCALLGVVVNQLLFFKGLSLTSPIHGSLMMLSTPILVTLIAAYIAKEAITKLKLLGLFFGIAGAAILILSKESDTNASNIVLGDIFIFINATSYALYLVLVKPLIQKYRAIIVIRWVFLLGCILVVPIGLEGFTQIQFQLFTTHHWYAVIFIVLGVTFFTYLWNIYAVQHLSSSIAGAYIYLQPLFAAIISVVFFQEAITLYKCVAGVLIFFGVWLATQRK